MCSVSLCVRNETSPTVYFWIAWHTAAVLTGTHDTNNKHSEPIPHDEETAHDDNWERSEYDDDPDYAVDNDNEEGNSTVIT